MVPSIGKPTGSIKLRSQTPVGQSRSCAGRCRIWVSDSAVDNTRERLPAQMDGSVLYIN